MIIIKNLDFEMEQVKSTPFFNLKLPVIVNEGKNNERIDMKIVAYGIPFVTCIQKIVSSRLSLEDEIYTAIEYMEKYAEQVSQLTKCVSYIYKAPKTDKEKEQEDSEVETEEEQENED